jgi:hypothetical protein
MFAKWIFVMMIEGKPQIVVENATEALCQRAMVRILAAKQAEGHPTAGACYILTPDESKAPPGASPLLERREPGR